jgi:hypothetical protein
LTDGKFPTPTWKKWLLDLTTLVNKASNLPGFEDAIVITRDANGVVIDVSIFSTIIQLIADSIELRGPVFMLERLELLQTGQLISPVTYSASMTINASVTDQFQISPTNGTAFTINAPTDPLSGQRMLIRIHNISGGALGAVTWNATFKMAGAWVNPANGQNRSIEFVYQGSSPGPAWYEVCRSVADAPN